VPIIMITAYGDAETKRQAFENGTKALLTKPIDFGTFATKSTFGLSATHNLTEFAAVHESGYGRSRHFRL
jgi:DNA-binding response OmpR family regulator